MGRESPITEQEFIEKIQSFYAQLQAKFGYPVQPMRMNVPNNIPRLEFMFQSVMTGQVAFIWINKVTGMVGWCMNEPQDVV